LKLYSDGHLSQLSPLLQRRASVRTRKGRCSNFYLRMILSEDRTRSSGSCACSRTWMSAALRFSKAAPA